LTLNEALFGVKEALESYQNAIIDDLLLSLSNFEPIPIAVHHGKPQNIDLMIH
jgi:hypothetical protein